MNNIEVVNSRAVKVKSNTVLESYVAIHDHINHEVGNLFTDEKIHISIVFLYLSELFSLLQDREIQTCYKHLSKIFDLSLFNFSDEFIKATFSKTSQYQPEQLGYVIDICHQFYLSNKKNDATSNVDFNKTSGYRKMRGAFYTPYEIALLIVNKTYEQLKSNGVKKPKILDMGCGTGVFLSSIAHVLFKNNYKKDEILNDLIFGMDVEYLSIVIAQILIQAEFLIPLEKITTLNNIKTKDVLFDEVGGGLFAEENIESHYDAIVMNPPYDRLKADGASASEKLLIEKRINHIKNNPVFKNSSSGSINMYSLFIDRSISLLKPNGVIGAIVPMTFLADKSATNIRKYFLDRNALCELYVYPESAKIFENVTQSCSIFISNFLNNKEIIKITGMASIDVIEFETSISPSVIRSASPSYLPIPCIHQNEVALIEKIHTFPRIKDIKEISNRRGELDLTLDKKYLGGKDQSLLKGISVSIFNIKEIFNVDFDGFIKAKGKSTTSRINDVHQDRLAGQQISNLGSSQRLKFAYVPKNYVLGNSLNYFTISDQLKEINSFNLYTLLGFLNSELLNWRFKLTSSNNHVNNYELDDLPIPINANKEKILRLNEIVLLLSNRAENSEVDLDLLKAMNIAVLDCYNLTNKDFENK